MYLRHTTIRKNGKTHTYWLFLLGLPETNSGEKSRTG